MFDKFLNDIEEKCLDNAWESKIPDWITKDIFEYLEYKPCWRLINDKEPGYIIGLSEDHWDYYWMYINNKDPYIHFITACFNVSKKCPEITKSWTQEEKYNIELAVKKYFEDHKNKENLIYFYI